MIMAMIRRYLLTVAALFLILEGLLISLQNWERWPEGGIAGVIARYPGIEEGTLLAIWGVTAIVLGGLLAFWAWRVHPDRQEVIVATRHGDLEISKRAIRALIKSLVKQVDGVRSVRSDVHDGPDGLSVEADLTVDPDYSMKDVVERFQKSLRTRLEDVFGISKLDTLTVRIDNVADEVVKSIPFDSSVLSDEPPEDDSSSSQPSKSD